MTNQITVQAPKRRFSVREFHQLMEAGILHEDDRVELIHGEVIQMSPIGPKHAGNIDRIVRKLTFLFGESAIIRSQNPIQLDEFSEPEPDISVVKPRQDFYTNSHPKPEEIRLIIELSESSLEYDRDIKLPLYAAAGIPEYWIIDLRTNRIIVFTDPSEAQYLNVKTFQANEKIDTPGLPKPLAVGELLIQ